MAYEPFLSHPRSDRVTNVEHDSTAVAKRVVIASADGSGNSVDIINSPDNIGKVATVLPGHACTENSTTTTLEVDGVFTGEWEDTINYNNIIVGIKTDQNSSTDGLAIQWSSNGTDVDDDDVFTITANRGKVFTFCPARRYFRVVFTNNGITETFLRLQTVMKQGGIKPSSHRIADSIVADDDAELVKSVISGEDPNGEFQNVGIQLSGALKTSIEDGQTGRRCEVEPLGALKTETPIRLVGTTFSNGTKDPNFWTETVTGSGSVSQAGQAILSTGTTANSTAKYSTVNKARKITGTTNQFRAVARNTQEPAANCIRRIGAYDSNDGFFFQFNGTTLQLGSRKSGSDILVSNGSFNGNAGATIDFGAGSDFTRIVIDYTALSAKFFIDGTLIHTIMAGTDSLTNTLNLPATAEIINENGNTTDNSYTILFATILRLGNLETNSKYYHISGSAATHVLKYNAGVLQKIMFNNTSGTNITIYDSTTASGAVIGVITTSSNCIGEWEYNVPFSNGLTLVTVGNSLDATIIYE